MTRIGLALMLAAAAVAGCQPAAAPAPPSDPDVDRDKAVTRERFDKIIRQLHHVHDIYGALPMFYDRSTGAPGLSWRVRVLSRFGQNGLDNEFKMDEAWDSPHNLPLVAKMPDVLKSPRGGAPEGHTYCRAFMGPKAFFPPPPPKATVLARAWREREYLSLSLERITDKTAYTILFAEGAEAVPWTKPDELAYDDAKPLPKLGGVYEDGFFAAAGSGVVVFVPKGTDEKTVRALITATGRETITDKGILDQLNPLGNMPPQTGSLPAKGK